MSNKKYFFMSGLPRSGNTLISSILNQNPKIKVSPNSIVLDIMNNLECLKETDIYKNFPDNRSIDNVTKNVFDLYYESWDCEYIIDRGAWGTPRNLFLLEKYLENEVKIISPVRDVLLVLASLYKKKDYMLSVMINEWMKSDWRIPSDKTIEEVKCDILMETDSIIEKSLFAVKNLVENKNRIKVKFIEYDDLVNDVDYTIKSIYDFFEIEYYNHDFNFIEQYEVNGIKYDEESIGYTDLHHIYPNIKKSNTSAHFLNDKIQNRYNNLEYWR